MTRVGAIDCGTNSVRLLIADVDGGALTDVVREVRVVRLGEGVDRTGRLAPAAIERTRVALHDYAASLDAHDVATVRMIATSASRDATNRDDFTAMVRSELDLEPDVITGVEEATLALAGALSALPPGAGSILLADIGGGSTELIRGGEDGPVRVRSMDVGSVRMTERHLPDAPPTAAQIDAVVRDVRAAIVAARADVPLDGAQLVGVAATVITIAAVALGRTSYAHGDLHGVTVSAADLTAAVDRLAGLTREQIAEHPVITAGRADVIVGGGLVLRTLLGETGADQLVVSEHDILDGIALDLAAR